MDFIILLSREYKTKHRLFDISIYDKMTTDKLCFTTYFINTINKISAYIKFKPDLNYVKFGK